MANLEIILVVGETWKDHTKEQVLKCFQDGLSTIPNFDLLKVNDILTNIGDPTDVLDQESPSFLYSSPEVNISVLQRPSVSLILNTFEKHLSSLPKQICLIYAGLICQSTGHWVLQNSIFKSTLLMDRIFMVASKTPQTLADGGKPAIPINLHVACTGLSSGGDWRHLSGHNLPSIVGRPIVVTVNRYHCGSKAAGAQKVGNTAGKPTAPEQAPIPTDISGVESFCQRLATRLPELTAMPVCSASQRVPGSSIRINRPCLYVFPEGSGQSAIFALPGFSLMVNTGCSSDPNAWKMAQHLENIDAIMQTHWGVDNLFGLTSLLPALMPAVAESQTGLPKVSCLLTPPPGGPHLFVNPPPTSTSDPFNVNLVNEVGALGVLMKSAVTLSRLVPMEITRGAKLASMPKPLPLFYKTGYGSLDLYPLTPTDEDQAEVKKLVELWAKAASGFAAALSVAGTTPAAKTAAASKMAIPLVSKLSVSALLIWRPATGNKKLDEAGILRILFVAPNAHQARILTALEGLHIGLPYIRQSTPVAAHETTTHASKKPAGGAASRPGTGVATARKPTNGVGSQRLATANAATAPRAPVKHTAPASSTSRPAHSRTADPMSQPKHPGPSASKSATHAAGASSKLATKSKAAGTPTKVVPPVAVSPSAESTEAVVDEPVARENGDTEHAVPLEPTLHANEDANNPTDEMINWEAGPVDIHHEDDEGDSNSVIAKTPMEADAPKEELHTDEEGDVAYAVDPVADWATPQALPGPEPLAGKKAATATVPPKPVLEGYFEASYATGGPGKAPYDKLKTTFVDVAFLPGGGDIRFVDAEWFKFIRARYYVGTTVAPTADLLKALVVGKEAWSASPSRVGPSMVKKGEDKSLAVSLILAQDTNDLLLWASVNEARMLGSKIDLLTVADRSTIQLIQADGDKALENVVCSGFRLDL